MKQFLIMLLVGASAMASPKKVIDTTDYMPITAKVISAGAISADVMLDSLVTVSDWVFYDRIRDTANWYIEFIGEKCDTAYKKIYVPKRDNLFEQAYERSVECKIDTAWAEKITPRLTEKQYQKLLDLIGQ